MASQTFVQQLHEFFGKEITVRILDGKESTGVLKAAMVDFLVLDENNDGKWLRSIRFEAVVSVIAT